MEIHKPDPGRIVPLIPATEQSLKVTVQPGVDNGIAVSIDVTTDNLGSFTIPLNAHQVGTVVAVCSWALKLNPEQIQQLRSDLARNNPEGITHE